MAPERYRAPWLFSALLACLVICPGSGVAAQTEAAADASARAGEPGPETPAPALPIAPPDTPQPALASTAPEAPVQEPAVDESAAHDGAASPPAAEESQSEIDNAGVVAMTQAGFGEGTIIAAIQVNPTHFDVRPRALVELKSRGVSEQVIDAMLAAESAKKHAVRAADARAPAPQPIRSEEFAKLTAMVEQLAARQEAAAATHREPDPPAAVDRTPHAWIERASGRTEIPPTIAQVAFTEERDSTRMKTLQGIGSKALAFANPALSGITTTIGNLFGSDNEHRSA
ncbi:MAG TPA: hypothetical protein VHH11_10040, partial [Gammaproteobacteria bacterium]|nr:hypothetical protein [Gammaproteobacteria bacterium]